jgi:hypothetical protein
MSDTYNTTNDKKIGVLADKTSKFKPKDANTKYFPIARLERKTTLASEASAGLGLDIKARLPRLFDQSSTHFGTESYFDTESGSTYFDGNYYDTQ